MTARGAAWRCAVAALAGLVLASAGGALGSLLWRTPEAVQLCVAPPALLAGGLGVSWLRGRPGHIAVTVLSLYALAWAVAFLVHTGPPYLRPVLPALHVGLAAAGAVVAVGGLVFAARAGRQP
ncbi:hypothetical protein [Actinocatenispora rupis]|uniref:hypothetical protein n=1 Tax=Actinocatenispora rupis TaxID=519421 RepID=UPI0019416F3C|nr:hypothetical protein [Actinocatenispora rupis]